MLEKNSTAIQRIVHRDDGIKYRHMDVMHGLKIQKKERRAKGTARSSEVYDQVSRHNDFNKFHLDGVHWLTKQLSCFNIWRVILMVSCKSGRHRSVALIRSMAESPELARTGLDIVQIDSADLTDADGQTIADWLQP